MLFQSIDVWIKLHRIKHHVIGFIAKWGFIGLGLEEGFEAFHPLLNLLFSQCSSIKGTTTRVGSMGCRLATNTSAPVVAIKYKVKEIFSKKKMGPKTKKMASRRSLYAANYVESADMKESACGEYIFIADDTMIPKDWKELYLHAELGIVPAASSEPFRQNDTLGELKLKAEYCNHYQTNIHLYNHS